MKRVNKILAFALTFVMAFAMCGTAWAATGDRTVDAKVSVTGFESGDTVTAYQFITWEDGAGWKLADGITGITIDQITNGLDNNELATLASEANIAKMTAVTGTINGATWEYECGNVDTAGSYLVLIASNTVEHIYNPVVVSADFNGTNDAAVDLTQAVAKFKKQDITVDKKADNGTDDYDVQVGDIVPFTVTVTVPQYNTNWTEPTFSVTDTLSTGLTIETAPILTVGEGEAAKTLEEGAEKDYTLTKGAKGDNGFTIQFTDTYLKSNASATVAIKYTALVGEAVKDNAQVHEETNKVTLTFSNDPSNEDSHKTVDDETHHYTFAIDATRLGQGTTKTTELLKVGVDADGNPITTINEKTETLPEKVAPLAGAEFTLTGTGANDDGEYELTATSGADGRIFFNNLEEGTYTLTETKAPAGYIKDQSSHTVAIDATYNDDTTLNFYTITIDGIRTSTYTAMTGAEDVTYEVPDDGNNIFGINNKKGTELPSTGGIGTTIFYVVGGVLVGGAAILLLTKRRATAAE